MRNILSLFFFLLSFSGAAQITGKHSFSLSGTDFMLDGKPFQMISGEMHCARIPRAYWRDRMRKARAMGLNTIGTYVFWNAHEPVPGTFDFEANNDIAEFVRIAKEEGLWVVMRPSPYVCAEWEFGGYPWWLLKDTSMEVRSKDPKFIAAYRSYMKELAKELAPLQITKGGNILMIQIENEYGSYGSDRSYMDLNRKIFREAGFDVELFTCDPVKNYSKGYLPGYLPAINGTINPELIKSMVNQYNNGKGPYYVAEWYPGWFDDWGKPHQKRPGELNAKKLDSVLAAGISINMYMFHGGTTRGFMNGANMNDRKPYSPQVSSYDYDAPLDEAGNVTEKFRLFRSVIEKNLPDGERLPPLPEPVVAKRFPSISLMESASIFDELPEPVASETPLCFEDLDQGYGFVMYRTILKTSGKVPLELKDIRDYASIYLNGKYIGKMDRRLKESRLNLDVRKGDTLDILVENMGRINFGPYLNDNRHGIVHAPLLNGKELKNWSMYGFPFENVKQFGYGKTSLKQLTPALYKGVFELEAVNDTYLDMRDFGKGFVFLNGRNLGRFWEIGPQQTIYVPAAWLNKGKNEITVFDALRYGHTKLPTIDHPILDQLK